MANIILHDDPIPNVQDVPREMEIWGNNFIYLTGDHGHMPGSRQYLHDDGSVDPAMLCHMFDSISGEVRLHVQVGG